MNSDIESKTTKILFMDDEDIFYMNGLERIIHTAYKHPDNPLIAADQPWEDNVIMGGTVRKEGDLYRMWYQGLKNNSIHSKLGLYAESSDGIHWEKPDLGLHKDSTGSYSNNLYLNIERNDHNFRVMYTPHMGKGKKYTLLSYGRERPKESAPDGYYIAFSDDGICWKDGANYPVIPGHQDVGWFTFDNKTNIFRGVVKTFLIIGNFKRRSVMYTQSKDGFNWDLPYPVVLPDAVDEEWTDGREGHNTQFYGMPIFRYESMLLGFLQVFKCTGGNVIGGASMDGTTDVQLVCSRDGKSWKRVGDRSPILERGNNGEWDWGIVQTGHSLVSDSEELRIYYYGSSFRHGQSEPGCKNIGMASWPKDRIVGLRAGTRGGEIRIPLIGSATQLHINANAAGGKITANITNSDGVPIYESNTCHIATDSLNHTVNLHNYVAPTESVFLNLQMVDAEIFSVFWE